MVVMRFTIGFTTTTVSNITTTVMFIVLWAVVACFFVVGRRILITQRDYSLKVRELEES